MELWDALDTRLCEALVRKGVDERGLTTNTRLTPDKLLAVLREKLARRRRPNARTNHALKCGDVDPIISSILSTNDGPSEFRRVRR